MLVYNYYLILKSKLHQYRMIESIRLNRENRDRRLNPIYKRIFIILNLLKDMKQIKSSMCFILLTIDLMNKI
jgi:hypothetical protein